MHDQVSFVDEETFRDDQDLDGLRHRQRLALRHVVPGRLVEGDL